MHDVSTCHIYYFLAQKRVSGILNAFFCFNFCLKMNYKIENDENLLVLKGDKYYFKDFALQKLNEIFYCNSVSIKFKESNDKLQLHTKLKLRGIQ